MKSNMINFLMFAIGAAIGSAVTWKLVKTKYERIADEEIESVKEVFSRRNKKEKEPEEIEHDTVTHMLETKPNDVSKYASMLEELKYCEKGENDMKNADPYVISPDEFAELDDYQTVSLNYYADGVVADDIDEVVENVGGLIGWDSLNHFGEYEDYSVFVRNDALKTDFEILLDTRNYSDVIRLSPYRVETDDE